MEHEPAHSVRTSAVVLKEVKEEECGARQALAYPLSPLEQVLMEADKSGAISKGMVAFMLKTSHAKAGKLMRELHECGLAAPDPGFPGDCGRMFLTDTGKKRASELSQSPTSEVKPARGSTLSYEELQERERFCEEIRPTWAKEGTTR